MFGYVLPLLCRLSDEEQKRYKAAYCGLCNSLKVRYGFRSRFLVNYDMTFLYCLLEREREEALLNCACCARPFCKRACMPNDEIMAYAADLTVLLSWWKLKDAVADSRMGKKLLSRSALCVLRKAYKKAAACRERENEIFRRQLTLLDELEKSQCASMDRVADTFATLLRGCVPESTPQDEKRILETLLYHVGRYLYLVDALEDLPGDQKKHRYNPLCYRYHPENGKLSKEDQDSLIQTIEASMGLAASALELLPVGPNRAILENIIYQGLPTVLKSVSKGAFRKRRSINERSV